MQKILGVLLLFVFASADAALINNGTYTTDTATGLDWLDLSSTTGLSMEAALAANSQWRYGTNSEVENIFSQLFDGYFNTESGGWSYSNNGAYADQLTDVINFRNLFGITQSIYSFPRQFIFTLGLYEDEAGIIREMGTQYVTQPIYTVVQGMDFNQVRDATTAVTGRGTFLVRSSAVPVPAAVWLFGSALGLLGWMRRKAA